MVTSTARHLIYLSFTNKEIAPIHRLGQKRFIHLPCSSKVHAFIKSTSNLRCITLLAWRQEKLNRDLNPSSPNDDQHQFSPNDIHTLSRDKVMRIIKIITKEKTS